MKHKLGYRIDEIALIFKACNSDAELNRAVFLLGRLHAIGAQEIRPIVGKLANSKKEFLKNQNHGRNDNYSN